ncbi:SpoIID/LytB domain-containing protein [bacterium]|nr:SpoIID/LytB domain-containing protein [bacterium]MBU4362566.1 SpoIID/LytB domain-containing protein [bacterium]MCG2762063.1 SpoIID/LytB domain-containing protein [Candidatus Atribacteria bacterium]
MIKLNIGKVNKFFLFLGICIFSLLIFTNIVLAAEKQPILRVGIFLDQTETSISGDGTFKIYNLKSNVLVSEERNRVVKLLPHDKGIEILGKGVYSGPIEIIPVGNTKIIVMFNGQKYRYRGNIEVAIDKEHRKLNVINIIGIEEYLYGVLKKEISPSWPSEALKAQAVAARTFAIFNMNKYIDKGYNICASTNSQAYGGVNHEDPLTNKAVDETRGIIMVYKGEPINAVYHSDSGGYTENSENVWGSFLPYLRSVKSKFEEKVSPPYHTWSYSINEKDLTEKLQKQGHKINSIISIEPVKKSETGRASELVFTADNNKVINMKTNDFRSLIGVDLIRSTFFNIKVIGKESNITEDTEDKKEIEDKEEQKESIKEILEQKKDWTIKELLELMKKNKEEKEEEKEEKVLEAEIVKSDTPLTFIFSGSGNGHGVGMSQWGAYGMTLQGSRYQDILKYYYQGIDIIKKY